MNILVINSGSSSIKFQLIQMPETRVLASGVVERIGIENGSISYKTETADFSEKVDFKDHAEEQNLPIPKEPIIFSKFTSCITN